jgi:hypothetical protein
MLSQESPKLTSRARDLTPSFHLFFLGILLMCLAYFLTLCVASPLLLLAACVMTTAGLAICGVQFRTWRQYERRRFDTPVRLGERRAERRVVCCASMTRAQDEVAFASTEPHAARVASQ